MKTNEQLLTVKDVASWLNVSEGTVQTLVRNSELTALKIGNDVRFKQADVAAYLEGQRTTVTLRQAASILHIPERDIRHLIDQKFIPHYQINGETRLAICDIGAYIKVQQLQTLPSIDKVAELLHISSADVRDLARKYNIQIVPVKYDDRISLTDIALALTFERRDKRF